MTLFRGRNILLLWGFLPLFCQSQNLISNPGFEQYSSCTEPSSDSSLENCEHWFNAVAPFTTVDWYSSCFQPGSFYLLPDLFFGYSYPHSGNAMIGFVPYSNFTNIGEAVGTRLSQTLVTDSAYCFGFWVKNSRNHNNDYDLFEMDIAFLADTAGIDSKMEISNFITLQNDGSNEDWFYLSGNYFAQGGEQFMLLGSFKPNPAYQMADPQTTTENCLYYFFDDFSLARCSKDSILSIDLSIPNVFTPNGDQINDQLEIMHYNIKKLDVVILNRWGNPVIEYNGLSMAWNGNDSNGSEVNEGVYFVTVIAETISGEVITKQQFVHLIK